VGRGQPDAALPELSREGASGLIVFAPDHERAARVVAEAAKAHDARMAENYHRLVIEDRL
jgi:hypothetical protein